MKTIYCVYGKTENPDNRVPDNSEEWFVCSFACKETADSVALLCNNCASNQFTAMREGYESIKKNPRGFSSQMIANVGERVRLDVKKEYRVVETIVEDK